MNNYAFIDTQNVNLSIKNQWWKIDRKKLFIYLREQLDVTKAYLFIWYVPENQPLYSFFQDIGYHLIFKPVLHLKTWQTKGNVDAELVLQAMIDYPHYDKAIIITGDGDFACVVKYLYDTDKLARLIVPNENRYSVFLQKVAKEKLDSLTNLQKKLGYIPTDKKAEKPAAAATEKKPSTRPVRKKSSSPSSQPSSPASLQKQSSPAVKIQEPSVKNPAQPQKSSVENSVQIQKTAVQATPQRVRKKFYNKKKVHQRGTDTPSIHLHRDNKI